ncbi:hypothetical protein ACFQS1_40510, partial [Paractinoplanes rhizophilus]
MADSAVVSAGVVQQPADQREALRSAVIAGPAGLGVLDAEMTGRLWPVLAGQELIGCCAALKMSMSAALRVRTWWCEKTPPGGCRAGSWCSGCQRGVQ